MIIKVKSLKNKRRFAITHFQVFCLLHVLSPAGIPWINVVYLVYSPVPHVYLKSTTFPQGAADQTSVLHETRHLGMLTSSMLAPFENVDTHLLT